LVGSSRKSGRVEGLLVVLALDEGITGPPTGLSTQNKQGVFTYG